MTIVTYAHRPKRARKRKAQAAAIPIPTIVTAKSKRTRQVPSAATSEPATIVTAKNPRRGRFGDVPDMTPEEHKRRGDAADALWRELVRRVREE
jgi:hypothetical protein